MTSIFERASHIYVEYVTTGIHTSVSVPLWIMRLTSLYSDLCLYFSLLFVIIAYFDDSDDLRTELALPRVFQAYWKFYTWCGKCSNSKATYNQDYLLWIKACVSMKSSAKQDMRQPEGLFFAHRRKPFPFVVLNLKPYLAKARMLSVAICKEL